MAESFSVFNHVCKIGQKSVNSSARPGHDIQWSHNIIPRTQGGQNSNCRMHRHHQNGERNEHTTYNIEANKAEALFLCHSSAHDIASNGMDQN